MIGASISHPKLESHAPYSSAVLTLGGALLMGLGVYFVALRPPLLAEDLRFIGLSLGEV